MAASPCAKHSNKQIEIKKRKNLLQHSYSFLHFHVFVGVSPSLAQSIPTNHFISIFLRIKLLIHFLIIFFLFPSAVIIAQNIWQTILGLNETQNSVWNKPTKFCRYVLCNRSSPTRNYRQM